MKVNISLEVCADEKEYLDEVKKYLQDVIDSLVDDGAKIMLEDGYVETTDEAQTIKFERGKVLILS